MDLCQVNPEFNLYDPEWPLRTYQPQAPPGEVRLRRGGPPVRPGARLDDLERVHRLRQPRPRQHPVPERPRPQLLRHRAVDPDAGRPGRAPRAASAARSSTATCCIPRGARIGYDREEDRRRHTVTEGGVVVVTADDEPLIGPIAMSRCALEAEADRAGPHQMQSSISTLPIPRSALDNRPCTFPSSRPRDSRLARQPDGRSRRVRPGRRSAAPRCRPAPRPVSARRWSCATATRAAISARACATPSPTSTARSRRRLAGQPLDQRALDARMIALDGTPTKSRLGANAIAWRVDGRRPRRAQPPPASRSTSTWPA